MSEKINLYVKFIQNEQKRLNNSTIVAPRRLNEVQTRPGGGGAAGPEPRVGPGGTALPSAYQAAMRRLEGKTKKEPEAPKPVPSSYEAALKRTEKPEGAPPSSTVSASAPSTPTKPKPEFKAEPLQVGTALVGAAGLAGGGVAVLKGMEAERERRPAQPPTPPTPPTPPKQDSSVPSKPQTPSPSAPPAPSVNDEDEDRYKNPQGESKPTPPAEFPSKPIVPSTGQPEKKEPEKRPSRRSEPGQTGRTISDIFTDR